MSEYVYVRLSRPEGYEDVHAELVFDDATRGVDPAFQPTLATKEVEGLAALLERLQGALAIFAEDQDAPCCLARAALNLDGAA